MKQTIEIEVPDGKKAVWKDEKIVFEDINPQLPKTWEKFCESSVIDEEYFIGNGSEITCCRNTFRYANIDKNLLPSKEAAKAHLALIQLHRLRDCYRQGWLPDWKDEHSIKYTIVRTYDGDLAIEDFTVTPIFLSFQSKSISEEFLSNFRELIEQAGDLI